MNPEAQAIFDEILKKDPISLSKEERAFLRARQSYLKKIQLDEYQDILTMQEDQPVVEESTVNPNAPLSYTELLEKAKAYGYKGKRLKRDELEALIKQRNPFD